MVVIWKVEILPELLDPEGRKIICMDFGEPLAHAPCAWFRIRDFIYGFTNSRVIMQQVPYKKCRVSFAEIYVDASWVSPNKLGPEALALDKAYRLVED